MPSTAPPVTPPTPPPPPKPTLYVADEDPRRRADLIGILEDDFQLMGAASEGEQALRDVQGMEPSVAILQADLPRLAGVEICRRLREAGTATLAVLTAADRDPEAIQAALAAGARSYLLRPFDPERVRDTLRRLVARRPPPAKGRARRPGKGIWAFTAATTGNGRTSVLLGCAHLMAQAGLRAAVVDLDLYFGDVGFYLGLDPGLPDLATLAETSEHFTQEILDAHLATHATGLRVLPSPASPQEASELEVARAIEIVRTLEEGYDYVLVDMPAGFPEAMVPLLDDARYVVTVTAPGAARVKNAAQLVDLLVGCGYARSKLLHLLSRVRPNTPDLGLESAGLEVAARLPADPVAAAAALRAGLPLTEAAAGGGFDAALRAFLGPRVGEDLGGAELAATPDAGPEAGAASAADAGLLTRLLGTLGGGPHS